MNILRQARLAISLKLLSQVSFYIFGFVWLYLSFYKVHSSTVLTLHIFTENFLAIICYGASTNYSLLKFWFCCCFLLEYLKPYGAKDRKLHEKKLKEQAELKRLREAANEGKLILDRAFCFSLHVVAVDIRKCSLFSP